MRGAPGLPATKGRRSRRRPSRRDEIPFSLEVGSALAPTLLLHLRSVRECANLGQAANASPCSSGRGVLQDVDRRFKRGSLFKSPARASDIAWTRRATASDVRWPGGESASASRLRARASENVPPIERLGKDGGVRREPFAFAGLAQTTRRKYQDRLRPLWVTGEQLNLCRHGAQLVASDPAAGNSRRARRASSRARVPHRTARPSPRAGQASGG